MHSSSSLNLLLLRHGCLLMFNCTARSLYIHSLEQHHNHSIFSPKTRVVISTFATINVNFTHAITSWRCYDTYGQRDVTRTWYLSVLKKRFELSPVFQSLVLRSRRSTSGDCFFFFSSHIGAWKGGAGFSRHCLSKLPVPGVVIRRRDHHGSLIAMTRTQVHAPFLTLPNQMFEINKANTGFVASCSWLSVVFEGRRRSTVLR